MLSFLHRSTWVYVLLMALLLWQAGEIVVISTLAKVELSWHSLLLLAAVFALAVSQLVRETVVAWGVIGVFLLWQLYVVLVYLGFAAVWGSVGSGQGATPPGPPQ